MLRGSLPALTFLVFSIGLGMGFSWSQGLIPLSLSPAKSGSLSPDVQHQEPLPPPNPLVANSGSRTRKAAAESIPDDPAVFEQQTEPDEDVTVVANEALSRIEHRPQVVTANRETEDFTDETPSDPEQGLKLIPPVRDPAPAVTLAEPIEETHEPAPYRMVKTVRSRPDREVPSETEAASSTKTTLSPVRNRAVTVAAHQDPTENRNGETPAHGTDPTPAEQLALAIEKLEAGETPAAHRALSKLYWNHKEYRPKIQDQIETTAKAIFFQSQPHFIEPYVIQQGDRLEAIAKKYQLSWEYLAKLNRTEPRRIQIGQKLKVVKGPFGAVVDLNDFALTIHLQGYFVKRYEVCIGKDGSSPIGKFSVLNKVENPPYTGPDGKVIAADDPRNPLGERWIDLGESYGIHGTIDPDSIGKAESRGCIRLRDQDIIEVYNFLVKGSEVVIRK